MMGLNHWIGTVEASETSGSCEAACSFNSILLDFWIEILLELWYNVIEINAKETVVYYGVRW